MFKKLVPVTQKRHRHVSLAPVVDFGFSKKLHAVPLATMEFPSACAHLPIVFLNEKKGPFPHLLLGLTPGRNLCVDERGRWLAGYMPLAVKRYPFSLVPADDKYLLCIDEDCGLFSQGTGNPLFDAAGNQGPELVRALDILQKYRIGLEKAEAFGTELRQLDLFSPMKIQIPRPNKDPVILEGMSFVDEKKLRKTSDENYLKLRRLEMIPFIFHHLVSLQHLNLLHARTRAQAQKEFSKENERVPDSFNFGD